MYMVQLGVLGSQNKALDVRIELQTLVNCPVCLLGTEFRTSIRAVFDLGQQAISAGPVVGFWLGSS